jgi:predicted RNA-binding protein with PIN domain
VPYLIDGNNLIGLARKSRRPSDEERDALVRELANRLRQTRATATIFFDGPAKRTLTLGPLSIRCPGGSADDAILKETAATGHPREIVVVTADRELGRRAREAGARLVSPEVFWNRFGRASSSGRGAEGPVDVEDWLRYFSDERNRG